MRSCPDTDIDPYYAYDMYYRHLENELDDKNGTVLSLGVFR